MEEKKNIPQPPQTPAQNASTNAPFFSSSAGWTSDKLTLRTHRSWVVGLRDGLRVWKCEEWKMWSVAGSGVKVLLRVE